MTKQFVRAWQHRLGEFFTLRRRLTLWTAGLLFLLGLGLTAYINTMTAIRVPQAVSEHVTAVLVPTQHPPGESLPPVDVPPPSLPQATSPPSASGDSSAIEQVQEIAIREVRIISLIGVGVFPVLGAIGAYRWQNKRYVRYSVSATWFEGSERRPEVLSELVDWQDEESGVSLGCNQEPIWAAGTAERIRHVQGCHE